MNRQETIIEFLCDLKANNDRAWFNENKGRYAEAKTAFEEMTNELIAGIATYDKEIAHLSAKDCIFRIYRDIRFSPDKSPYKRHFGAYIAKGGGRKSQFAGYYLHLEPDQSVLVGGLFCPENRVLKNIRNVIFEDFGSFKSIVEEKHFQENFGKVISYESLKKTPVGFPSDFEGCEYLKYKHFLAEHKISDAELNAPNFIESAAEIFKHTTALNHFLNDIVEE